MTRVIYVDILFLENLIIDYLIIYFTAFVSNRKLRIIRAVFGSVFGAVCSVFSYFLKNGADILYIIFTSVIIIFISFKIFSVRDFIKLFIAYFSLNFILAGGVWFAEDLIKNKNDIGIEAISILIGIIFICVMGKGFYMILKKGFLKNEFSDEIILYCNNKKVKLKIFADTGNFLIDPITKVPVIIASKEKIKEIFDTDSVLKIKNLRFIPCSTISEKFELLYGFVPDRLIYKNREINAVVAISKEEQIFEDYDAIINPIAVL